jgi:hypothetical protein
VIKDYKQRAFPVKWTMVDNEFEPTRVDLADVGVGLNEARRDEHVPQVKKISVQ